MTIRKVLACGVAVAALTGMAHAQQADIEGDAAVYATEDSSDATGVETFGFAPSLGAPWPSTPITLTLQIPNGSVDSVTVSPGDSAVLFGTSTADSCVDTGSASANVSTAAGAAEIDLTGGDTCSAAYPVIADVEYTLDNGQTGTLTLDVFNVNASVAIGDTESQDFASYDARFGAVEVESNDLEIDLPDFLTINNSAAASAVASVSLEDNNINAKGPTGGTLAVPAISVTLSGGDFAGLEDVNGETVTATSTSVSFTVSNGGSIDFDPNDDDPLTGGDYSVDLETTGLDNEVTGSGAFTVKREGTDLIFPFAFDEATESLFAGAVVAYRIANNGSSGSGEVILTLNSWDNAPVDADANGSATTCELVSNIEGGSDLDFRPSALTACFGDFGTGDFTATVRLNSTAITGQYAQINSFGSTRHDVERR